MKKPQWLKMLKADKPGNSKQIRTEITALESDMKVSLDSLAGIEDNLRAAMINALADPTGQDAVKAMELEKKQTKNKIEATRGVLVSLEEKLKEAVLQERIARQEEIEAELVTLEKQREVYKEELFSVCARAVWLQFQVSGHGRIKCTNQAAPLPAVRSYRETFYDGPLREMLEKSGVPLGTRMQKLRFEHAQIRVSKRHG